MAITVGCDPEFLAVSRTNSKMSFEYNFSDEHGVIGSDHGGRVGELRPMCGTPKQVVENIRYQMKWINLHDPDICIIAGGGCGYGESIGGHIHIGLKLKSNYVSHTRIHNRGMHALEINAMNPEHKLFYALDFFIGRRMKKLQGGKRGGSGIYGALSDVESKIHGFEYRTPPSWLTDPILAESTLVVTQQIAELWQLKPNAFDAFMLAKKLSARRSDYNMLIPANGTNVEYIREQVEAFRSIIFSDTYQMATKDTLNLWLQPPKVKPIQINEWKVREVKSKKRIQLQLCQLKLVEQTNEFLNETFLKVCRFALSEVKIYPLGEYSPWQFQLTKDLRLRPDTAYFSKELRPYLKIKRGKDIRVRFVDLQHRIVDANDQTQIEPLPNVVFFNVSHSTKDVLQHVISIFETGARTKIRNNEEDDNDE